MDELGIEGPIAAVTAGWQEREADDEELRDHLRGRTRNLGLYRRNEEVFAADPELFAAHRERQDRLKELQRLYRLRLDHALAAARALQLWRGPDPGLLEPERRAAIEGVRALDAHHVTRVAAIDRRFEERWRPAQRPAVARHRRELAAELADCGALAIAGGHVAVLLNRLRLFGVLELAAGKPIFAWSAGAMVLARRIVLFHDSPPQGAGNAEVLERGLKVCPRIVPLPHAARRLRLGDPLRVSLFARRFQPLTPVTLDAGARLIYAGGQLAAAEGARRLTPQGLLVPLAPAAAEPGGREEAENDALETAAAVEVGEEAPR